jgi:predicted nucleic acid-binding protein
VAVKIVDASAICAVLFSEPGGASVTARLAGAELMAPALLPFEVANTCLKKIRLAPGRRTQLLAGLADFTRMRIAIAATDPADATLLAERTSLSAYDASYLWLAWIMRAELVTLDRRLQRACAATQPNRPGAVR